ncbi:hypothetical protein L249_2361 [Ophiocordyceps polyrhachis-furcata BCC 54312]|uniref:DUF7923 domain-containing protein n=1 Tax=Ophiocordyceps polyrhachis-furcata BCC 54312 TaxID=1330021 RepID=A0A367LRT0_9HYPO|nr:hypothetical protein L249_2361 [Ophiocordyceps polyrhachis-furcata BCC 54312]
MAHIVFRPPEEDPVVPGMVLSLLVGSANESENDTLVINVKISATTPDGEQVPPRLLQRNITVTQETKEDTDRLEAQIRENQELRRELRRCKFKLADATYDRQELRQVKELLRAHEMGLHQAQFHDHMLQQGAKGGRAAAQALQATVADHFGNRLGRFEVIVRVMVDFERLAQALGGDDVETRLRDFAYGFTETPAMFKFVGLRQTVDMASTRLHEMADWHLQNCNCRHVILGLKGTDANIGYLHKLIMTGHDVNHVSILPTRQLLEAATGVFGIVDWTGDYFRNYSSGTDGAGNN